MDLSLFFFIGIFLGSFVYWNHESRVSLETYSKRCCYISILFFRLPPDFTSDLITEHTACSTLLSPSPSPPPPLPPPPTRPDKKQLAGWNICTTSTFRATSFHAAISFLLSLHDEKMNFNGITISLCPLTLVGEPEKLNNWQLIRIFQRNVLQTQAWHWNPGKYLAVRCECLFRVKYFPTEEIVEIIEIVDWVVGLYLSSLDL